jgi:hypothetical protein
MVRFAHLGDFGKTQWLDLDPYETVKQKEPTAEALLLLFETCI